MQQKTVNGGVHRAHVSQDLVGLQAPNGHSCAAKADLAAVVPVPAPHPISLCKIMGFAAYRECAVKTDDMCMEPLWDTRSSGSCLCRGGDRRNPYLKMLSATRTFISSIAFHAYVQDSVLRIHSADLHRRALPLTVCRVGWVQSFLQMIELGSGLQTHEIQFEQVRAQ